MNAEQATNIQIVMNTLETLTVPATFENANRLVGIYNLLTGVRDKLMEAPAENTEEVEANG